MKLQKRGETPKPNNSISTTKDVFGPPALIEGENPADYGQMLANISRAVKPKDFLDEIWVRDVADLTWECLRMRRLKAALLSSAAGDGLETLLRPLLGYPEAQNLSKRWVE